MEDPNAEWCQQCSRPGHSELNCPYEECMECDGGGCAECDGKGYVYQGRQT